MNTNYENLKQETLEQHNLVRTDPTAYLPVMEKYIKYFKGKVLQKPGLDYGIQTSEGKEPYVECIAFLKKQKAVNALELDEELSKAAQDHADDIGPSGCCDHMGSDGSDTDARVSKYVEWDIVISENIDFGALTGEEVIVSLLADDGIANRGHRTSLFSPKLKYIGIGVANHAEYGVCTVIDYIGGITSYKKATGKTAGKPVVAVKRTSADAESATPPSGKSTSTSSAPANQDDEAKEIRGALLNKLKSGKKSIQKEPEEDLPKKFQQKAKIKDDDDDNPFKDDPDAPAGAVSCKTKTTTKKTGNKTIKKIVKTYKLEDGSEETVETEEIITGGK